MELHAVQASQDSHVLAYFVLGSSSPSFAQVLDRAAAEYATAKEAAIAHYNFLRTFLNKYESKKFC